MTHRRSASVNPGTPLCLGMKKTQAEKHPVEEEKTTCATIKERPQSLGMDTISIMTQNSSGLHVNCDGEEGATCFLMSKDDRYILHHYEIDMDRRLLVFRRSERGTKKATSSSAI